MSTGCTDTSSSPAAAMAMGNTMSAVAVLLSTCPTIATSTNSAMMRMYGLASVPIAFTISLAMSAAAPVSVIAVDNGIIPRDQHHDRPGNPRGMPPASSAPETVASDAAASAPETAGGTTPETSSTTIPATMTRQDTSTVGLTAPAHAAGELRRVNHAQVRIFRARSSSASQVPRIRSVSPAASFVLPRRSTPLRCTERYYEVATAGDHPRETPARRITSDRGGTTDLDHARLPS